MDTTRRPDARAGDTATAPRTISPTDVSQFIRLEQCERYLRLRLHERAEGRDFLYAYDVAPQPIPPILTRSGQRFEQAVEADIAAHLPAIRFGPDRRRELHLANDNAGILEALAGLGAGETVVLFQPRIEATIGDWRLRGDVDLLRAERDAAGALHLLIADMKSSTASRVEHRLQVAFYHEMLATLLAEAGISHAPIELAILYRGPVRESLPVPQEDREAAGARAERERQREDAERTLGTAAGLLDRVRDVEAYLGSVRDLVTGPQSTAHRVLRTDFEEIPFHLTWKCDGCLYNAFCMKRSAETDNLSLLPHITEHDKRALERAGITTTRQLASLKSLLKPGDTRPDGTVQQRMELVPRPEHAATCERLAATWPVGPRLDELIHRALRYESWKTKEQATALSYIPNRGYGSMPYSDAEQNPNLVRVYLDVQHDYLLDRVYMLGALVVGNEGGQPHPKRRRSVVRLTQGPPDSDEREEALFLDWITETLRAIVEAAAPNAEGEARAPIHLTFVNGFAQRALLDGLARHKDRILGATALYDFVTQLAAFDSAIASYLETEIREHRNYPMVCQSLQSVATFLKFNWNAPERYRDIFRARVFDYLGRFDAPPDGAEEIPGMDGWFTSRARFTSQIPLEYAYAAWGELPVPGEGEDEFAGYRAATPALLQGFHARRLEAMEHIAGEFAGNRQTSLREFELPDLEAFEEIARDLAHALREFVVIERHVELAEWKRDRLAEPEQRMLSGQTLIVQYLEEDQAPGVAAQNRENIRRRALNEEFRARYREEHPEAKQVRLPKEQKAKSEWSNEGMRFRLHITTDDVACDLEEALRLSTIREGDWLVIFPRWTFDSRLPEPERYLFTPTAKQLLYGMRCTLERIDVERDEEGRAVQAWVEVTVNAPRGGGVAGFTFGTIGDNNRPLEHGEVLTLDPDPSNIYAAWTLQVTDGLIAGGENALYDILARRPYPDPDWPDEAAAAQRRFLDGLHALHAAEALHDFEESKREFIGAHGDTPVLLVQGPPGTGKSYSTAFAVLARIQGAIAADRDYRVFLSCKTHAATDVLLENVLKAQELLRTLRATHSEVIGRYIDERVIDLPLYRYRGKADPPAGVTPLPRDEKKQDRPKAVDRILANRWAVVAATPGGIYGLLGDHFGSKERFGHHLADCLVLDEASQMSMPEAIMAALPLRPGGNVIVVGDHRQMPPIVKHDWASEPRRSFRQFRAFESLFLALLALDPPMIRFAESFRLHADMARFLRDEIYIHDGIEYHSHRTSLLPEHSIADDFLAAVLAPEHPLTVVVHDETSSQVRNDFERQLLAPVLRALSDPAGFALDAHEGLGVVVPHRAQRAALQDDLVRLLGSHSEASEAIVSAVDTVERFQGGERNAILIGATESDRDYILMNGEFLLDPRRLTVALSRAKQKLVLVAARSVFEVFSADEETFENAQLWKNLLRKTCTVPLWQGECYGHTVIVWGNHSVAKESIRVGAGRPDT